MNFTVTTAGDRLDQFLHAQVPERSRSFLQKLIEQGDVSVNDHPSKASYKVRVGDRVSMTIPAPTTAEALPEAMPLEVLFEDADLIVLNKAPGMVVHPATGNREHTLVNALLHHCRGQLAGIGGVERPGIVHRLDKGTSGCLVVAKTDLAHQSLVEQFKARVVTKIYRAVCRGVLRKASGRIETTIGRSERDRKKMSATARSGRPALTEYRVLKQHKDCALVELTLHTGRTHQIRVHMAHLGNPLVGDATYGGKSETRNSKSEGNPKSETELRVERPLLHAYKLGFTHPRTGKPLNFTAPLPADIQLYE